MHGKSEKKLRNLLACSGALCYNTSHIGDDEESNRFFHPQKESGVPAESAAADPIGEVHFGAPGLKRQ